MNSKRNPILDVLYDLHARKLSLPAGILAVLLIAIMVVLPREPGPEPTAAPVTQEGPASQEVVAKPAANITFFGTNVSLKGGLNVYRSKNPFGTIRAPQCRSGQSGGVFAIECTSKSGKESCVADSTTLVCTKGGLEDLTGGGGGGGGGGVGVPDGGSAPVPDNGGSVGGGDDQAGEGTITYVVNVTYDETVMKNVESGRGVPSDDLPMLLYAGADEAGKKAQFLVADGLSVQGAAVDSDLGLVSLAKGDQIVLTEADGTTHSFILDKIIERDE